MVETRIAEWLASGDTGSSSEAIMLWLWSKTKDQAWGATTPSDPADLGRCLRLLERIPEWKARMPEMAEAGGLWPVFAARWDEMASSMEQESGIHWEKSHFAPLTYDLMKAVEMEARAKQADGPRKFDIGNGISMSFGK